MVILTVKVMDGIVNIPIINLLIMSIIALPTFFVMSYLFIRAITLFSGNKKVAIVIASILTFIVFLFLAIMCFTLPYIE